MADDPGYAKGLGCFANFVRDVGAAGP